MRVTRVEGAKLCCFTLLMKHRNPFHRVGFGTGSRGHFLGKHFQMTSILFKLGWDR